MFITLSNHNKRKIAGISIAALLFLCPAYAQATENSETDSTTPSASSITTTQEDNTSSAVTRDTSTTESTPINLNTPKNGWYEEDGEKHYYNSSDNPVTGWNNIEGSWYYFGKNGAMQTKTWINDYWVGEDGKMATNAWVDDNKYYVGSNGAWVSSGWIKNSGKWTYVSSTGMPTGWKSVSGTWYFFDNTGVMQTGWIEDNTYYLTSSGAMATGWTSIDKKWYYFNGSGVVQTKTWIGNYWVDENGNMATNAWVDGDKYYVGNDGLWGSSGWVTVDGNKRYISSSGYAKGWKTISSKTYYFDSEGNLQTGLVTVDSKSYYLDSNGVLVKNTWVKTASDEYRYAGSKGVLGAKAIVNAKGNKVLVDSDGNPLTGIQTIDGVTFYCDETTGELLSGWVTNSDGTKSYHTENGLRSTGWASISGKWYYFDEAGIMQTGWVKDNGSWYWLDKTSGVMQTGWIQDVDDTWYYLYDSGVMARDTWIKSGNVGYYLSSSGAWTTSIKDFNKQSSTGWLIVVDRGGNGVGVYQGSQGNWNLKYLWSCCTGGPGTETPTGTYHVGAKGTNFGEDHGYTCWWYTQIIGNILFHSQLYYPGTFDILDGTLGRNVSQGCIRLELANARWIYDHIPAGTTVYIYD